MMLDEAVHKGLDTKGNFLPSHNVVPTFEQRRHEQCMDGNTGIRALEKSGSDGDKHRNLGDGSCSIFAEENYFDPELGLKE
jgi:hypothetical protein